MNLLITGHKGFIGSNALNYFKDRYNLFTYEWDDSFLNLKKNLERADWVLHFGAISSTTEKNIEKVFKQNVEFTQKLLYECINRGVNIQFSSSASVYGNNTSFKEEDPVNPLSPYAWSKYCCEKILLSVKTNIVIQVFRYFNVWGPNEDHKKEQASPYYKFKKQAETKGFVEVFKNSNKYKRDFIHVNNVLKYQEEFIKINKSGLWNIGSGTTKSFYEVAKLFTNDVKEIPMPDNIKQSYQQYTCADMTKTMKTLFNK
jgi:ADP-L-glycero-D-manno-heptose 6-epimerase